MEEVRPSVETQEEESVREEGARRTYEKEASTRKLFKE